MKDFFNNLNLFNALLMFLGLILTTIAIIFLITKVFSPRKKERIETSKKIKAKKETKEENVEVIQEPVEEPKQEVQETETSEYISPYILDRTKYEVELRERLEREKQEEIDRQAMETARLEMLKNKEFQSHAGYISTLQRFSKKDQLENQLANGGKVDRELLNTYLNEKSTSISEEFANMSPELKAVILSDLMKRKY